MVEVSHGGGFRGGGRDSGAAASAPRELGIGLGLGLAGAYGYPYGYGYGLSLRIWKATLTDGWRVLLVRRTSMDAIRLAGLRRVQVCDY